MPWKETDAMDQKQKFIFKAFNKKKPLKSQRMPSHAPRSVCTENGNLIEAGYSRMKTGKIRYENVAPYLGWAWPPSNWPGRSGDSAAILKQ
jgi:hypothetical protein